MLDELSGQQVGQPVTESLPLEDVPIPAQDQQQAKELDGPRLVDETLDQDAEPDRFSTGD